MITVNGKRMEFMQGTTIAALLEQEGFRPKQVVVERNEAIVSKAHYETTILSDGDRIEILNFVGGG